ncbi:MAG: superfamily I DNA/RNA helicase [Hydrococcus sp. RU_2_2]|nr:superfamily I DNA/RNA helicase [Hydrococcus sp. RU_2_2]NJP19854.1 superfamily I DNA/RNA helicase [Hydrococcus sp. CRU_1_1]
MLELPKLIQIVKAWLEYIRLEEMTSAEVEKGRGNYQKVFDSGVRLANNKLLLDSSLFEPLQQQYLSLKQRGQEREFQIAVAGPQIYWVQGKGKEQKLKYLPLFTIDISDIFQGNYRQLGWDLTEFEFQPVMMNLMRLYKLEEEQAESLIITEGIFRFLEDTFKKKFSTLQAFINQIDLPDNYKTTRSVYLVRYNFVPYNAQLKQDLREILQQLQQNPCQSNWLRKERPAFQYLYDFPPPPRHDVMFWGAFPTHPPDEAQAKVLKHVQENCLTALWGAPGTGKTETGEHLVALPVVQRARQILRTGKDENHLIVFASTNNSAIHKFQTRLDVEGLPTQLYLSGGNQNIIRLQTLPQLLKKIGELRTTKFDPHAYEQAKLAFIETERELQHLIDTEPSNQHQRAIETQNLEQLEAEIQTLNDEIAATTQKLQTLQQQLSNQPDYSHFPLDDYQQIQVLLEETWQSLPRDDDSRFQRFLDWLGGVTDEGIFEALGQSINIFVLRTLATPFPFQPPSNRAQLLEARKQVSQQIQLVQEWNDLNQFLKQTEYRLNQLERSVAALTTDREQIQAKLDSYPTEDFYSRFYRDDRGSQVQLFQRAFTFLQLEALRRSDEVIRALETYGSALSSDGDALLKLENDGQTIYRDLSLVFPVITTSLHSLRNMFPHLQPNLIKLALVDEAGTTLVHQLFPLLVRSQQAVVAGDPQQIEPIINLCDDAIRQYRLSAFLDQGLSDKDYYRYAPTAKYTATAYHRAAGATGQEGDLGTGIVLRNHYRSPAAIISFCSPNYPDGLIIHTPDKPSKLGTNLIAYHVEGSHIEQANPAEIDGIVAAIEFLLQHGYSIPHLGVMSPYLSQANALKARLRGIWRDFNHDDIGTVHKYVGGQKKAILFSPYQCLADHSFWFINRKPNLLNTAVSRAEELFVVVGNLQELEKAGGETARLIQHIRTWGKIYLTPSEFSVNGFRASAPTSNRKPKNVKQLP